jgi:DNA-binding transcriptional MerR regulator
MQGKKHIRPRLAKIKEDSNNCLPPIPEKRYFTIGETAHLCNVKPHVLRYWEQEFFQLKPSKRSGNRRYYQYKDVMMVRQIRKLLYENGFTIEGARTQLLQDPKMVSKTVQADEILKKMIADLEGLLQNLQVVEDVS